MKKAKKIISFIVPLVILFSFTVTSFAAMPPSNISPQWQNIGSQRLTLYTEGENIYIGITLSGLPGTTYTNGTIILEKISGTNPRIVAIWTNLSSNSVSFSFINSSITAESGLYRVTITIDAVRNGYTETIILSKEST